MQIKKNYRSMRKIKRAIKKEQQLSENTWKSLSAEQMEKAVQYFVFSISGTKPGDGSLIRHCDHLLMCDDNSRHEFSLKFESVFGKIFPRHLDAKVEYLLKDFIGIVTRYAIKLFRNKSRPTYVRR